MKTYNRLKTIAEMCIGARCVADIGCDHAKLCVHLIKHCGVERAFASEITQGPLNNAIRTIENAKLREKIIPVLCDGLDNFSPSDCDYIVIAGMGADEIISIIQRANWVCDGEHTLILQPMTHPERVRKFACCNGFEILDERMISDSGWLYTAIKIRAGKDKSGCLKNAYLFSNYIIDDEHFPKYIGRLVRKYAKLTKNRADANQQDEGESAIYNMLLNASGGENVT